MPPCVVLVGPPASGKSSIGSLLADTLHVDFSDTDVAVEAEAKMPIADIFLLHGESEFRRLEEQASISALEHASGVLALGGGAIELPSISKLLVEQFVVQLRIGADQAAKRAGIAGARPVVLGNLRSQWSGSMARRDPMYAKIADLVVDTGVVGVEACVADIAAETLRRAPESGRKRDSRPAPDGIGKPSTDGGING